MRVLSTLTAAALLAAASFASPAAALTLAGLTDARAQFGPVESVARVCREVCRGGFCRERCFWEPNRDRSRVRVYEEDRGRRAYGREYREERRPGIEFRVGPGRDYY
jgi:hypothetical protein